MRLSKNENVREATRWFREKRANPDISAKTQTGIS
jgi:hypothetical protein